MRISVALICWKYQHMRLQPWSMLYISAITFTVIGHKGMKWSCAKGSSDWPWGKGSSLELSPQASDHSTKPVQVQGCPSSRSGWSSWSYGLVLESPVRSKELDSIRTCPSKMRHTIILISFNRYLISLVVLVKK